MNTHIIPALDFRSGNYVRLEQGRFDSAKVYGDNPLELARHYQDQGARYLHLVDLDAAEGKGLDNTALIQTLAQNLTMTLQVGGGLRTTDQVRALLDGGVSRVVVGSLAVKQPELVRQWLSDFGPDAVVLALDVHSAAMPVIHVHGWQTATDVTLWQALEDYTALGLRHVLCTDISRDGMQSGPSVELYEQIMTRHPTLQLQASGGVRDRQDIADLGKRRVPFAISGRALLEGTLALTGPDTC
ncbi:MAG: 1-(5-phosphoribosyl)-5-[(5-phosphoribosylamino)methylideneamino]imidazole-4-carboxamide isomerase [Gammaproteobacteria bacterium]